MNKTPFELCLIKTSDGLEPLKAIVPTDGSRAFVVGEDWEVKYLYGILGIYLEAGAHQGEITELHEQLGNRWLTAPEAIDYASLAGEEVPGRTIRWAAKHGFIDQAEKAGRDWRMPETSLRAWLMNRPRPGRK